MYVTECSIGTTKMTPESARDKLVMSLCDAGIVSNGVDQLRAIAGLCNAGEFDAGSRDLPVYERKINGDATDQAILRFSEGLGPLSELRRFWKKDFELAFNSKNKFMIRTLSLVENEGLEIALPQYEASQYNPDDTLVPSNRFDSPECLANMVIGFSLSKALQMF